MGSGENRSPPSLHRSSSSRRYNPRAAFRTRFWDSPFEIFRICRAAGLWPRLQRFRCVQIRFPAPAGCRHIAQARHSCREFFSHGAKFPFRKSDSHTALSPLEQRRSEMLLKVGNHFADRRLGIIKLRRRCGKAAVSAVLQRQRYFMSRFSVLTIPFLIDFIYNIRFSYHITAFIIFQDFKRRI